MLFRPFLITVALIFSGLAASAADETSESKAFLDKIAGVYKYRFETGDIGGGTYEAENIFEVVPISDKAAYVKAYLNFFNAHTCDFAGIAEYEKANTLRYFDPDKDMHCPFAIRLSGNTISFDAPDDGCYKFCGARGNLNGDQFKLKQKRPIKYMPLILKSPEYNEAVKGYNERKK